MIREKKVVCVIPARLASSRFPKKVLALLAGKPLVQWAYEGAVNTGFFDQVLCAVDDKETAKAVEAFGGSWKMTPVSCPCGTDRIISLLLNKEIDGDLFVCWQADEPFVPKEMIADLLQTIDQDAASIWTLKKQITAQESLSPHTVKVVTDSEGMALYFSRSQIPYYRDETDDSKKIYYKHIGLYAYTKEALLKLSKMEPTPLELAESLENLRYLESGFSVRVHKTSQKTIGIDLPEHLIAAQQYLDSSVLI